MGTIASVRTETRGGPRRLGDFVMLMKPRIILLLLVTTVCAMWVAANGAPDPAAVFWVILGGTLSSGGANALNMWFDRDIDAVMVRTRNRPVAASRMEPAVALRFGIALGVVSFFLLWHTVNLISALLSTAGLLFYVLIYTMLLKRSTPQNIVIGGAAGAVPPLVGWAAVTGDLSWAAFWMFLIIFLWTPPHFWALALFRAEDYARAKVPMLPVARGVPETKRQIFGYSVAMVISTLLLYPWLGPLYITAAAVTGVVFVGLSVYLLFDAGRKTARMLFGYSIVYLTLIFAAMVADRLLVA